MRRYRRLSALTGAVAATLALSIAAVAAQSAPNWPTRTVRFIVTLGPGSGTDIGGRLLSDRLSKKWGQPVVIENRPGGDGIVGITAFTGANDDHVLLLAPSSSFTAHPYLHKSVPYKDSDLIPVAQVSKTFVGITVPAAMPAKTLDEVIALAKQKPGQLNWASVTGANAFMLEGFLHSNHLDVKKVPYRNGVEAANDLAENRVQLYISAVAIAQPQIQSGRIKLIAVINTVRTPAAPDVPTAAEAGHPGLTNDGLVGLFCMPSFPAALREKIAADVQAVMESDPIIKDRLTATGQLYAPGGPAEFAKSIDEQRHTIATAAKSLGVKANY